MLAIPEPLDALADELDFGELGHIEEIGALEVGVALLLAGVQRRHVDGGLYLVKHPGYPD